MKVSQILTNFTAGVFSPRLNGRVDISKYYNACRTAQNMIVYPHGGASRRFGTVYVAETKASATGSRLLPFQFNAEQAYVLEMGDEYLRFYKDNGQIMSGVTPYEIATPYTSATFASVQYVQNADTMRLVNSAVYPQILTRTGHTAWTMASSTFISAPVDWSAASGYPSSVTLYEQRSVYAGTTERPQTMWFSSVGNLDDMSSATLDDVGSYVTGDDDGMELTLDDPSVVRWMTVGRFLHVGTAENAWIVSSGATDEAITPTRRKARRVAHYGSSSLSGIAIGNAILFIQRVGRKIRELIYDYVQDSFGDPPDLTIFAEHVTKTGIKAYAFQSEPDQILWCVLNDGTVAAFTYNKSQDIAAWHTHDTASGLFEDVVVIPAADHDQVWFQVKRTIGAVDHVFIEYLAPDFDDTQANCWFVDCGLKYSGTGATTITGLDHLEGEVVSILADGAVMPDKTVASGTITISSSASTVIAGLGFTSILEPMDLEIKSDAGTSQGKRSKIHAVTVRFYKTLGAKIGSNASTLDIIPFRKSSDPMDSAPALFTGDKTVPLPGGWDRHKYIRITQEQPLPMTVLAIVPVVNVND